MYRKLRHLATSQLSWLVGLLLFVQGCACSDNITHTGILATDLNSPTILFPEGTDVTQNTRTFLLYNKGTVPLQVESLRITGASEMFQWSTNFTVPLVLEVGKEQGIPVTVRYQGKLGEAAQARLEIQTSETSTPALTITLRSLKLAPFPEIACGEGLTQTSLAFGSVQENVSKILACRLRNRGSAAMTLQHVLYVPTKGSPHAFHLLSMKLPVTVPAGSMTGTLLRFVFENKHSEDIISEGNFYLELTDAKGDPLPRFKLPAWGGKGFPRCFAVTPDHIDLGETNYGCYAKRQPFRVYRIQTDDLRCKDATITGFTLASHTASRFKVWSAEKLSSDWQQKQVFSFEVEYRAKQAGSDLGVIQVQTNVEGHALVQLKVTGETTWLSRQKDVFTQLHRPLKDILWVIENSPAMMRIQQSLAKNLQSYINWAVRRNEDYHIAVTTPDISGQDAPPGCLRGNIKIITPKTKDPIGTFLQNARVGFQGSSRPQPLEAAYRALQPDILNNPHCNKGFYRKEASLEVIFISATPDVSPQLIQHYISFFRNLKGFRDLGLIRASVVTGPPPTGCSDSYGRTIPGAPRMWEVAKALKGVQEVLCNQNWAPTLSNIGGIFFGYRTQYFLRKTPAPSSIQVKVNGTEVQKSWQDGWSYDGTNNSINFSKAAVPPPGATVEVSYHPICQPKNKEWIGGSVVVEPD